ncbi:MAG: alkaline phosphatase [Anaerolineales bacterium]|nr:alkaline phosphatase [Anaerolineales bacterium]
MKRDFIFVVALIFLQAYNTVPEAWQPAPVYAASYAAGSPARTPAPATSLFIVQQDHIITPTPILTNEPTPTAEPIQLGIERVVIVSFDGMRPDAIEAAGMTNLLNLIESSAYTFTARTISYSATLPGHTSMLSGLCMEKHGMRWNGNNLYRGYAVGTNIFDLTHDAGMKSIMDVGKEKLRLIAEPETTDDFEVHATEAQIAAAAVELIPSDFDLLFIHFPSADLMGHKHGWMTNAQFGALREGDAALGKILAALDENGMRETTLVIVTADHGGHDKTHDGTLIEDYHIPWIVSGPGVIPQQLTSSIRIMDTAATTAYALGLPIPPEWDGIPVYEAFGVAAQDVHYRNEDCE